MQTLWSRAAQSKCSCRCSSCLSAATAVARHTSTGTGRRRLKAGEAFTLFYSSIFATAAVADAKVKENRRQEWDRVIDEARGILEMQSTDDVPTLKAVKNVDLIEEDFYLQKASRLEAPKRADLRLPAPCEDSSPHVDVHRQHQKHQDVISAKIAIENIKSSTLQNMKRAVTEKGFHVDTSFRAKGHSARLLESRGRQDVFQGPFRFLGPTRVEEQVFSAGTIEALGNAHLFKANHPGRGPLPPNSVGLTADERAVRSGKPLSLEELKTLEYSVAKLALRLVVESHPKEDQFLSIPAPGASHGTSVCSRADLDQHLHKLEARLAIIPTVPSGDQAQIDWFKTWESPQYPYYTSPERPPDPIEGKALNEAIQSVLKDNITLSGLDIKSMIYKISYNLLVSNTPPNIDTYNLLIIHLCRLRQNEMVSMVLDSLFESHVRLNEVTISAILKYLTVSRNVDGFTRFVRLMQGLDGGLMLANPSLIELPNGKIVQEPLVNHYVFGALINGASRLFAIEKAIKCYENLIRDGYHLNSATVAPLLRKSALTANWDIGNKIWQSMTSDDASTIKPDEWAYFWMLHLCKECNKDTEFADIYKDAIARGCAPKHVLYSPQDAKSAARKIARPSHLLGIIPQQTMIKRLLDLERPSNPIYQLSIVLNRYMDETRRYAFEVTRIRRQSSIQSIESTLRCYQAQICEVMVGIAHIALQLTASMARSIIQGIQDQILSMQDRVNGLITSSQLLTPISQEQLSIQIRDPMDGRITSLSILVDSLRDSLQEVAVQLLAIDLTKALNRGASILRKAAFELEHYQRTKSGSSFASWRAYRESEEKTVDLVNSKIPKHLSPQALSPIPDGPVQNTSAPSLRLRYISEGIAADFLHLNPILGTTSSRDVASASTRPKKLATPTVTPPENNVCKGHVAAGLRTTVTRSNSCRQAALLPTASPSISHTSIQETRTSALRIKYFPTIPHLTHLDLRL